MKMGKPIDYIFIDVNPAFEQKTGLKRENIIGKKVTEVLPGTATDPENFIGKYGAVALGGESIHFEAYSSDVKKWFLINAYSPQKYYFVVMFKDIDQLKIDEKKIIRNDKRLEILLEILEYKSELVQDFLDFALNKAILLTDSKIGYIYFYDEKTKLFTLNSWSKDVMESCKVQEKRTTYELDKTGIWGEAVRQRKSIMINDFKADNPLKKGYPDGHVTLINYLTIPIFRNEGIVAVVAVANKLSDYDNEDELQLKLLMENVWKIKTSKEIEINYIKKLEGNNIEMQKINSAMLNRETKMIQLKEKLKELGVDPATI
jgi:PAS domain S-box-containing protein